MTTDPKEQPCPNCGKKGLHFANHPHAAGYKNYDKVVCRFCKKTFTVRADQKQEKQA
jgi:hypothetical protein